MARDQTKGQTVKAGHTMFRIIDALQELDGAGVTELSKHLDIPKSTVHSHLRTLYENEYVVVDDSNTYELGLKFLERGWYRRETYPGNLPTVAEPVLERLADETGEAVWLMVEEHGRAVYLNKAIGEWGAPTTPTENRVGKRQEIHNIAAGKAILAHLPEERVRDIIDRHGLVKRTDRTITDPETLFEELEAIRERGYAYNTGEMFQGARAVAAPIVVGERVYGSITVAGPEQRMKGERFHEELPNLILAATNELELKVAHQ